MIFGMVFGGLVSVYMIMSENGDTKKFDEFCGGKDKCKYLNYGRSAGIAINTDEKMLYIGKGKLLKKYPFSHVREWAYISDTYVSGVNTGLGTQSMVTKNSLQIDFKDVDNARWNLKFSPEMSYRWVEILNQEIRGV